MGKVTAESLYNDLKSSGTLKEEVLTVLKRVWSEQVYNYFQQLSYMHHASMLDP